MVSALSLSMCLLSGSCLGNLSRNLGMLLRGAQAHNETRLVETLGVRQLSSCR